MFTEWDLFDFYDLYDLDLDHIYRVDLYDLYDLYDIDLDHVYQVGFELSVWHFLRACLPNGICMLPLMHTTYQNGNYRICIFRTVSIDRLCSVRHVK